VVVTEGMEVPTEIKQQLLDTFKEGTMVNSHKIVSLSIIYSGEISGGYNENNKVEVLSGKDFYETNLFGYKFTVSPFAFFQVNTVVFEKMLQTIGDFAGIDENTTLLDICCGTGAIGICLSKTAKKVIGVELLVSAVENAKANVSLNADLLQSDKMQFIAGRAEETLPPVVNEAEGKIIGIVDPPRSGLHGNVLKALRTCKGLDRLVYVSCNAAS